MISSRSLSLSLPSKPPERKEKYTLICPGFCCRPATKARPSTMQEALGRLISLLKSNLFVQSHTHIHSAPTQTPLEAGSFGPQRARVLARWAFEDTLQNCTVSSFQQISWHQLPQPPTPHNPGNCNGPSVMSNVLYLPFVGTYVVAKTKQSTKKRIIMFPPSRAVPVLGQCRWMVEPGLNREPSKSVNLLNKIYYILIISYHTHTSPTSLRDRQCRGVSSEREPW